MAKFALRPLLKSFCTNSPWKYAVLWKLRHRIPLIPNWPVGGSYVDLQYAWGEGKVPSFVIALKERLELQEIYHAGPPNLTLPLSYIYDHAPLSVSVAWVMETNVDLHLYVYQWPEEWLLQFASGIKTIVLVPVLPHGVLQLGSSEMVVEDLSIPAYIKVRFTCKNIHTQSPLSVSLSPFKKLEMSSSDAISQLNSEDSNAVDSVEPKKLLALDHVPSVSLGELPSPLSQSVSVDLLAIEESELFSLYCLKEELGTYTECNAYGAGECGEILDEVTNPYPTGYFLEPPLGDYDINDAGFLNFPEECEFQKVLGQAFERQGNEYLLESSFLSGDAFGDGIDAKGGDAGYLLQAVVGHVFDCSVDIASRSTCIVATSGQHPVSSRPQGLKSDSITSSRLMSAFSGGGKSSPSSKSISFKSTVSTVIDNENLGNDGYYTQSRKGKKQSAVCKGTTRPGDSPRPRPRDRQMIQDRLKELRELVPNGPKYSIDALLDQTVKHMLYLRSVTKQAEKLRQWVHREVFDLKNMRLSEAKDGYQTGTSWAFEIRDERKVCPIVVKDLAYPGHLLVEMLCNEHGLFLEIAQVIRSFNLTILKGVMESCSNNTWAHFIVETSSGFHRLDIFWPLMKLLQRQRNPISSKDSMMTNHL
ncbi:Basic helix-loop-helix DNA-binding superfamily protein [Hibiscus syriacus]|uniref:Basic helix-loop-helix DNA-binding superfamily protein n=1 Tax=Hibiscus syriacus TaxID=106335 RepID=A0A6A3BL30_HIBSY|nr:Basic helix-loop-helix DNA-binding superfamily protein [Hibiscus syriacus]